MESHHILLKTSLLIYSLNWCYRCIDHFLLPKSCVSLTFSSNGSFLATAHVDDLGIYLWNNQSLFTQVSLRALESDYVPKMTPLPGSAVRRSTAVEQEAVSDIPDEEEFASPEQIADSLVTLSLLPDSRWKNLLNLDAIKVISYLNQTRHLPYYFISFYFIASQQTKRSSQSSKIGSFLLV